MDSLIKGVRLPKKNEVLWLAVASDGTVKEGYGQIPYTKAIEIPEHGRLIDADLAIKNLDKYYCKECDNWNGVRCKTCDHYWAMQVLEDAPTVLEANNVF